ncbi:MAG: aldehyde dehydrogenase family protein, partial [Saprospiraceae bacterium]|nr:aldehyde dehydrogenase family protein [Saprospiraceae bacterium]
FNVLQGGPEVGRALVEHPDIAKVSLTGEVSTGIKVMQSAAKTLKKVTLELGGKSPMLIFSDADLEQAVHGALLANFYTQGEICSNGTRVFVQREIKEDFLKILIEKTKKIKIGDPKIMDTQLGALISREHLNKVENYIKIGKSESTLIYGGNRVSFPDNPLLSNGNFIEPAIFDCGDHCAIAREEIFGPVLSVLTFDDEDEVINRANQTPYGLAAGVFTKDLQRAHRVVHQLQAGVCWINNYNVTPVQLPFGGYKMSGLGRENGLAALDHYTQIKTVYVEMNGIDSPY